MAINFENLLTSFILISLSIPFFLCAQPIEKEFHNYWSRDRVYTYWAVYSDLKGQPITEEQITISPTEKVWDVDPKQTLINIEIDFNSKDSASLAPTPLNGIQKAWRRKYQEGVIQSKDKVWMHPIRTNQYLLTELAPFPDMVLPPKNGLHWVSTLWIYEAFGSFEGTVEAKYRITGQMRRNYPFGQVDCWEIKAVGVHDHLGKNTATYYFNEIYGFTEMNYEFYNGETLEIKLSHLER